MFFDEAYRGTPPWEIGRPQPAFERLAASGAIAGTVLDIGCGTGENALALAARGHEVWGVDSAPHAIERARLKAFGRGLPAVFLEHDALELETLGRTFETAIDSGCFHVFDDPGRARYVRSARSVLEPGGRLHVLCFSEREPPGWGPRRVTQAEIRTAFARGWRVDAIVEERFAAIVEGDGAWAWLASLTRL